MSENKLVVRNLAQKALFIYELQGQISDGNWENSRPSDHYKMWCDLKESQVEIGEQVGRNFYSPRCTYNLTKPKLLDIIGERMMYYVRIALVYGIRGPLFFENSNRYPHTLDMNEVRKAAKDESIYNRDQLIDDLKDLKIAFRTYNKQL